MPLCPECGAEIDRLIAWSKAEQRFIFSLEDLEGHPTPHYEATDTTVSLGEEDDYECPECVHLLFQHQDQATAFLRGEVN